MGSYKFSWSHPAEEVYVTGTFDNWGKTVKLDANGPVHEKTVELPESKDKILYKFVADGVWQHDHTAKSEEDDKGNTNNVLYPEDITPAASAASADTHHISTVAPGASTLAMAAEQPLTKDTSATPGSFPEEPAEQTFSVNPIPASEGAGNPVHLAPGERVPDPSTINDNTISSHVHDDLTLANETQPVLSVAPIPATGGIGNPVHIQPGEPVPDPSTLTSNTVESTVKHDAASYEKSDAAAPVVPPATTSADNGLSAAVVSGLGPQTTNLIPESSMGLGNSVPKSVDNANISSVDASSTTAGLAGQVPLEPRGVPVVVADSQDIAGSAPEASSNPAAVQEKSAVEQELKDKVPEEPATTGNNDNTIAAAVAGGVAGLGAAAVGAATFLRQKAHEATGTDPVSVLPQSVQDSIGASTAGPTAERETAAAVPNEVTDSIKEAGLSPEAAANPTAVKEKSALEQELLSKVGETQATGEPAPGLTDSTAAAVPAEVTKSIEKANGSSEAAANPVAVHEKSAVEQELLSNVKQTNAEGESAPATSAATAATLPAAAAAAGAAAVTSQTSASGAPQLADPVGGGLPPITMDPSAADGLNASASSQAQVGAMDSHDVSPMTSPAATTANQTAPVVTTGVDSATAPAESKPIGTPRKPAGQSNSTPEKRQSFMNRLKGTPESSSSKDPGSAEKKKKGFMTKLKEKFKS